MCVGGGVLVCVVIVDASQPNIKNALFERPKKHILQHSRHLFFYN